MSMVPIADLIAVLIGIAIVAVALAVAVAITFTAALGIIVVAIVLLVAVSMFLGHSDGRREGQRQNCSRTNSQPGLD